MRKIKTGHEIFDSIANLPEGSFVLVLDEGHFDSILFLNSILSNLAQTEPVVVIAYYDVPASFKQVRLEAKTLNDLSIFINQLREKLGRGVIIHHYLPQLLVKEGEAPVLKMIEHWVTASHGKPFLEFFTLPRNTYHTFERMLQALLSGFINLTVSKVGDNYIRKFSVLRVCDVKYHGVEFPYIFRDGRLLIKLHDEFTDRLTATKEEKLEWRRTYLKEHKDHLRIIVSKTGLGKMPPQDCLLLTQLSNMTLNDIEVIFPDKFEEIIDKIAEWSVNGFIETEELKKSRNKPIKNLGFGSRAALALPNWLATKFLGKHPRKVPLESLLGSRKTIEAILQTYLPDIKEPVDCLVAAEKFFHEIAGRITAAERVRAVGEDPRAKFDIGYLPKIASLTLWMGFGLGCKVEKQREGVYEVKVKDCFACEGASATEKPVCYIISGTLAGALSQAFKERVECEEVKCKALGDQECSFIVRLL
ncbi:MAG: V4R domain-containing protein [Candidatus Bathyarchaeia archaeon]